MCGQAASLPCKGKTGCVLLLLSLGNAGLLYVNRLPSHLIAAYLVHWPVKKKEGMCYQLKLNQKILFPGVCCRCRCCWGSAIFGALSRFVLCFRVFLFVCSFVVFFLTVSLPEGKLLGQDTLPLAVLHTNETDVFLSSFVTVNKGSDELPGLAAGSVAGSQNCAAAEFSKKSLKCFS